MQNVNLAQAVQAEVRNNSMWVSNLCC